MAKSRQRNGMKTTQSLPILGLTGGIATGKSTAADHFVQKGARLIDADQIAHDIVRAGTETHTAVVELLTRRYGEQTTRAKFLLNHDALNRPALNELVFSDASFRKDLERLLHPKILEIIQEQVLAALAAKPSERQPIIVAVPLLFENGFDKKCFKTLVITCSAAQQMARLRRRDEFNTEEAKRRIESQMPMLEKEHRADWVVNNDGTIDELRAHLDALWPELEKTLRSAMAKDAAKE